MSKILISGASGLIGSALVPFLESRGHDVIRLVRHNPGSSDQVFWDPTTTIPPQLVSGFEAVIHLSGESVAGRWTAEKKRAIRDSRVVSTQNLSAALAGAEKKPRVFLSGSAIGYYGNRGDEILTESSPSGAGFLAEISRDWEAATASASDAGLRVVNPRIGIVLSKNGGALKPMLLPFRLGLGGRIGSGRQWWSWIHIDDLIAAMWHILQDSVRLNGPVNLVAPNPVTNAEFTQTLAHALHRPAILPVPAFAVKLALGEFANEGLLSSARVQAKELMDSGLRFQYSALPQALAELLELGAH